MADPRFYRRSGPFALGDLAARFSGELGDAATAGILLSDIAALDEAVGDEIAPLTDARLAGGHALSKAGAFLTSPALAAKAAAAEPLARPLLLVADPRKVQREISLLFHPSEALEPKVAATALVAPDASVDPSCRIEAGAVIGAGASVGARCHIGANAVVGDGVVLGADCVVGASASLTHAIVGDRVEIYPGARVGTPGFGFLPGPCGPVRIPQYGRVVIGDDVEIGANATVDRGTLGDTVIGAGTVLDNLVHVAHNVRIGRGCVIAGQTGIAGSATIGDGVMMGGQCAIRDHVTIASGAKVAGGSAVIRDVGPGETVGGYPAVPVRLWHRQTVGLAKLFRRGGARESGHD